LLRAAVLLLEPLERFFSVLADPSGSLLRSIDPDALPIDRVGSTEVRVRDADSGSLPDLSDFVTAHYPRLIRLAGLITRNIDDAEDAVQAALERAWRGRAALRDKNLLKQWIDRIVVREASRISGSRVRRLARLVTGSGDDEREVDLPDARARGPVEMTLMRAAYERLSADQRAVVSLHLYAGYTVAETAEIVGAPIETVRSRLRVARERLRAELEPAT
jgi:RNA polymerase sigma-70 factor (ECF subfamily)